MKQILVTAVAMSLVSASAFAASLTHDYELNGSLADSLGGPTLNAAGGTLGPVGYTFGANQGLALLNGINPTDYSIEMFFHFDSISGFRKIVDFKDLSSDAGLYNLNSSLNFYPRVTGPGGDIPAGVDVDVVLTRDGGSGLVNGYVNHNLAISFFDVFAEADFSAPNNVVQFFKDDFATGQGEAAGGFVDYIRVWDGALSGREVAALPGPTTGVPDSTGYSWMAVWAALMVAGYRFRSVQPAGR